MLPIVLTVLAVAFVAAIYGLFRLVKGLEERADEMDEQAAAERDAQPERVELGEPLGPDGIAYLAAHKFVPSGVPRNPVNARKRAYAPVTGDELEPRRLAEHMLHAVIVSFVRDGRLQLKVGEQDPSFMPPFPHKRWVLRLVRKKRLDGCPLAEALDVALDLAEQRTAKKGADVADGIAIDELIEDMLKVMRQEMSFWEKAGVYADIRQYLEAALIDQGYLIPPSKDTWIEKLRHVRATVNEEAVEYLEDASEKLAAELSAFRMEHGSEAAQASDSVPGGRTEEVDDGLVETQPPFEDLPLHDCLKVSVYEALLAIRQLEPSEDVGV